MATHLFNKDTGADLGEISADQLEQLEEFLEEEGEGDHDYWINPEVLDYMEEEGADPELVKRLRDVAGDEEGIEIEWREA
jgi:hypothetical protein